MRDLKVLHTIRDVPTNNDGLCALSPNNDNPYLAYPGSSINGEVQIFNTNSLVNIDTLIFLILKIIFNF